MSSPSVKIYGILGRVKKCQMEKNTFVKISMLNVKALFNVQYIHLKVPMQT